jgi:hypothetical protein
MKNHDALRLTCVFSKTSYSAPLLPDIPRWVANADGTAVRYLGDHPYSSLHDPLTGVTTHVPPVPEGKYRWFSFRPQGVLYRDGTILLYTKHRMIHDDLYDDETTMFWAALLRPRDTAWTVVERILEGFQYGRFCVTYHGGNILVSVESSKWHVIMINDDAASDMIVPRPSMPTDRGDYYYRSGHLLESRAILIHNKVEFVEWLPQGWRDDRCVWLVPQLTISPVHMRTM